MLDERGVVLYVGKARDLKKRLSSYFSKKTSQDIKTAALLKHVKDINITITHTENEALLLECNLIKKLQPHYNILFRDDKSYPYILVTDDLYPRIDIYRGQKKRNGMYFGPFPNASAVRETIHIIEKIFKIRNCTNRFFAARTRPCMQYQIDRCTGPCVGLVTPEEYQEQVRLAILFLQGKNDQVITAFTQKMEQAATDLKFELAVEAREQIKKLREIQARQYISSGYHDADVLGFFNKSGLVCIQLLMIRGGRMLGSRAYFPNVPGASTADEILSSFISQHYLSEKLAAHDIPKEIILEKTLVDENLLMNVLGEAAQHKVVLSSRVRGERKKWLEIATTSAEQSASTQLLNQVNIRERFAALQELVQLNHPLQWIECFDISHSMGEATVGSCVVFNKEGPVKSHYRRFNISGITPGDDTAAMHQTLTRRYHRPVLDEAKLPDIVLIDGGLPQLNAAKKVLSELDAHSIFLIGVAKGVTRKPGFETLHFTDRDPIHLPNNSLALHLIQQIRDEAHRFAITAHRQRRDKKRVTSTLESISGIGAKRRRDLLRYFGGIQAINRASLEEIAKVPGISKALAERIFKALHN